MFFLHKSGFRIAGHKYNIIYFTTTASSKLSFEIESLNKKIYKNGSFGDRSRRSSVLFIRNCLRFTLVLVFKA